MSTSSQQAVGLGFSEHQELSFCQQLGEHWLLSGSEWTLLLHFRRHFQSRLVLVAHAATGNVFDKSNHTTLVHYYGNR